MWANGSRKYERESFLWDSHKSFTACGSLGRNDRRLRPELIQNQILYSFPDAHRLGAGNGWGRGQGSLEGDQGYRIAIGTVIELHMPYRGGGRGRGQRGMGGDDGLIPFR